MFPRCCEQLVILGCEQLVKRFVLDDLVAAGLVRVKDKGQGPEFEDMQNLQVPPCRIHTPSH